MDKEMILKAAEELGLSREKAMEAIKDPARFRIVATTQPQNSGLPSMVGEQVDPKEIARRNLGVSSMDNTFANFKPLKGTEAALKAFRALGEGTTDKPMLLCYGGVGNGKTHLCEATIIALNKRGLFTRYYTMSKIMQALKSTMKQGSPIDYDTLLERYQTAERLVIDDAGMGSSGSEWAFGVLEDIIDARYHDSLVTILTTNRDLNLLPERVVSRFSDKSKSVLVLNAGADQRPNLGK